MRTTTHYAASAALVGVFSAAVHADGVRIIDLDGNSKDVPLALAQDLVTQRLYVVAGSAPLGGTGSKYTILAFNLDGSPATAFGDNGRVHDSEAMFGLAITSSGVLVSTSGDRRDATGAPLPPLPSVQKGLEGSDYLVTYAIESLPDGRVLTGGGFSNGYTTHYWGLARYTANGALDPAFGNGAGWVDTSSPQTGHLTDLHLTPGGRIIAIGPGSGVNTAVIGAFNSDGSTDVVFGTNGFVTLASCQPFCVRPRVFFDAAGRMLVGGGSQVLSRLTPSGDVDPTFTGVPSDFPGPDRELLDVATGTNMRIVVFGTRDGAGYAARFLPNGPRDTSFGIQGEVLVRPGTTSAARARLVAGLLTTGERPVLLMRVASQTEGTPSLDGPTDIALVRLKTDGTLDPTFAAGSVNPDLYPEPFTINSNTAPFSTTYVVSDPVSIDGINGKTSVYLQATTANSAYSVNCTGTFVSEAGTLNPGDTLCLRHTASGQASATVQTTVNVGGRSAIYSTTSTTQSPDITPNSFSFQDKTGVVRLDTVTSDPVTITGLTGPAPVVVENGSYAIGCAEPFHSNSGFITNGQTVCVRHTASANAGGTVSTTLAINGVTDVFTSTTTLADTTPDAFSIPAMNDVAMGSVATSSPISITGIDAAAPLSISGGEYSIGCNGTWSSQAGSIAPNQQVCVRHTSASQPNTSVSTTLTVGGVSSTFTSTTAPASAGGSEPGGSGGGGGAFSAKELLTVIAILLLTCTRRRQRA